jgi:hypothetical protein
MLNLCYKLDTALQHKGAALCLSITWEIHVQFSVLFLLTSVKEVDFFSLMPKQFALIYFQCHM